MTVNYKEIAKLIENIEDYIYILLESEPIKISIENIDENIYSLTIYEHDNEVVCFEFSKAEIYNFTVGSITRDIEDFKIVGSTPIEIFA